MEQKSRISVSESFLKYCCAVVCMASLSSACNQQSSKQMALKQYTDAGISVQLPSRLEFESSSPKGLLIMRYPNSSGFLAEPSYCLQVVVTRKSQDEMKSPERVVGLSQSNDFNFWLNSLHINLSIRREARAVYLRRDIRLTNGGCLYAEGEVKLTAETDQHIEEAKDIIESIQPLR